MNKITYFENPLYVSEALYVLDKIANDNLIEYGDCNLLRQDCDTGTYLNIINKIKDNYDFNSLYLFKHLNVSKLSIANCLFCFFNAFELEMPNLKTALLNKINDITQGTVNDISASNCLEIIPGDNDTFINKIINLNLASDIKINILKALYNPSELVDLIYEDIRKIIPVINDLFKQYNNDDYKTYYTEEFITKLISENYIGKEENCIVIPSVVSPTTLALNIHDEHENKRVPTSLHVGILIDYKKLENENLYENRLEEYLEYFIKVLNDSSKMKIIELLKDKEMYGAQIAKSMNLKTPTVSHHMIMLINAGIVTATKENNRINYSYNKDKSLEIIDYLKTKFI